MRSSRAALLTISLLVLASPAAAQTPYLVRDVNQSSSNVGSYPEILGVLDGVAFFSAAQSDIDRELWRTDGTESGTWQVMDICEGGCSSFPRSMSATPAGFFFTATDGLSVGLWITRGEPASTFRLTGEASTFVFTSPRPVWDDRRKLLFFVARDARGDEIWRSDGTAAGTYRVTDVHPRFEGPGPADLTLFGGDLLFWGNDGRRGPALWATDGTPRGTRLVKSFGHPAGAIGGPTDLQVVGRVLVFLEIVPSRGIGLWKSDGTTRGTTPLAAFGTRSTVEVHSVSAVGSRLFFTLSDGPEAPSSLWVTNGTANGTRKLGSFAPESAFLARIPFGSKVFFQAADPAHGRELWITDGTPKGTRLFKDFCPGPCSSFAYPVLIFRNRLVIFASTPNQGREIWTSNGTPAGTRILRDVCPGSCDGIIEMLGVRNGRLYFFADGETSHNDIWSSNGTFRGTSLVRRFGPEEILTRLSQTVLPTGFLFSIFDQTYGQEPWHSDGTAAGTHVLRDIATSVGNDSEPRGLMRRGDEVFFFAADGIHGSELWKSDGTGEGTLLAAELTPGREPRLAPILYDHAEAGSRLFFRLDSGLWRTDGTQAGTLRVTPEGLRFGSELAAVGDRVFFNAGDSGEEIWVSDGTVEGTRKVGDAFGRPERFTSFQGRLYFSTLADQIWRSDGTPEGTGRLPGTEALEGVQLPTVHNGSLFFFAYDYEDQHSELWRTDGSPAGTALVTEVGIFPDNLVSTGERLFFSGNAPGQELWVSDGTAAGTRKVADDFRIDGKVAHFRGGLYVWTNNGIFWKSDGTPEGTGLVELEVEGIPVRGPLVAFGDRLYTSAAGALVETDGTSAGTRLIRGTSPSWQLPSNPEMVSAGPRLFFFAFDEETGTELWALPDL